MVERDSIRNLGSEKNVDMNPYQMQDPIYEHIKKAGKHLEDSESVFIVFVNPPMAEMLPEGENTEHNQHC